MQEEEVELTPLLPKHLVWAAQTSTESVYLDSTSPLQGKSSCVIFYRAELPIWQS